MKTRRIPLIWMIALPLLVLAVATLAGPQIFISKHVTGSGGGDLGSGTPVLLTGTVGQTVVTHTMDGAGTIQLRSGFWQPAGAVSGVSGEDIPRNPELLGNYPNPFNPMTEIRFAVGEEAARARLRIFDIQGRLVKTLVDEMMEPGVRRVTWRGGNDRGSQVASGLYFYRLEVGAETFTNKMLLLK